MTVDQIMEALGGYTRIAEKTGIPATTVHSWKRAGFIPDWRRPALLALAKATKAKISADDFPDRPTKSEEAA